MSAAKRDPRATEVVEGTNKRQKKNCPSEDLICPLTLHLPWDPVTAMDGKIYDRHAIEEYFSLNRGVLKSPLTKQVITNQLLPAPHIKSLIETMVKNGAILDQQLVSAWNKKVKEQNEMEELLQEAKGGDAEAMYDVGIKYELGDDGFKKDENIALSWYKKAHEGGNIKGTAVLGLSIIQGLGGATKRPIQGLVYITHAASQGSNYAACMLGKAFANGCAGLPVDQKEAIFWLKKAAGECKHDQMSEEGKKHAQDLLDELQLPVSSSTSSS